MRRTFPRELEPGETMSVIQKIIRRFRVRRGHPRTYLAEKSGVYHRTIDRWETESDTNPRVLHLAAVLDALDLELWVINRDDGKLVDRIY